jgi:hypothetical protein
VRVQYENGWITREEIAVKMRVGVKTLNRWINDGLLVPIANHNQKDYFAIESVDKFCADYLRTDQVAKLLGVQEDALKKWIKIGRLVPVYRKSKDGCRINLFKRQDVEKLRRDQYLTAAQMAGRVGLTYVGFMAQIKTGKFKPISGPGVDNYGRYLFEIPPDSYEYKRIFGPLKYRINLTKKLEASLRKIASSSSSTPQQVLRAKILLLSHEGQTFSEIKEALSTDDNAIAITRKLFREEGLDVALDRKFRVRRVYDLSKRRDIDFPSMDVIGNEESTKWVEHYFHPNGLKCPKCGLGPEQGRKFRQTEKSRLIIYRCKCGKHYNLYTGTTVARHPLTPAQLVLLLRGMWKGETAVSLSRELRIGYRSVLAIRRALHKQATLLQWQAILPDTKTGGGGSVSDDLLVMDSMAINETS